MEKNNTYCALPFNHLYVEATGDLKPCCIGNRFKTYTNLKHMSIDDAFNTDEYKQLRLDLLNGVRNPLCKNCWDKEDIGIPSHRQQVGKTNNVLGNWSDYNVPSDDGYAEPKFEYIDIRFSNLCNFKCIMCNHDYSSTWYSDKDKKEGKERVLKIKENFVDELIPHIPKLKSIYFAGGEPLIMPEHFQILNHLHKKNRNISIIYNTNLSVIKYDTTDLVSMWKDFKSVMVQASVDGLYEIGEKIRPGFNTSRFLENIKILKDNNINYHISQTTGTYNLYNSFDFINQLFDLDIIDSTNQVSINNLVIYPSKWNIQNMPKEEKKTAISFLEKHKSDYTDTRLLNQIDDLIKFINK